MKIFTINLIKIITKEYYDEYIKLLSNIQKKKKNTPNYIANDIYNFIKKNVTISKENLDLDTFIQNASLFNYRNIGESM